MSLLMIFFNCFVLLKVMFVNFWDGVIGWILFMLGELMWLIFRVMLVLLLDVIIDVVKVGFFVVVLDDNVIVEVFLSGFVFDVVIGR